MQKNGASNIFISSHRLELIVATNRFLIEAKIQFVFSSFIFRFFFLLYKITDNALSDLFLNGI